MKQRKSTATASSGDGPHFNIDARGATDPAQVEAIVKVAVDAVRPFLVKTEKGIAYQEVTVKGQTLKLALDFPQLAAAESAIARQGRRLNLLLAALDPGSMASTEALFISGLHTFHPEIKWQEAAAMLSVPEALMVAAAIFGYLTKDLPPVDPPQAAPVDGPSNDPTPSTSAAALHSGVAVAHVGEAGP